MPEAVIERVTVHALSIPLRGKVEHAASVRGVSDSIVVAIELRGGVTGYGETLPRAYVTKETVESVLRDIEEVFVPVLVAFHARSFPDALDFIDALPFRDSTGRGVPAARAAVELALLDVSCHLFGRSPDDIVQWMGLPGFGSPGSLRAIRYSGVLASDTVGGTWRRLRLMVWAGLRQFKLKVGVSDDLQKLQMVCAFLGKKIAGGRASLRVDANGIWTPDEATHWLGRFAEFPLAGVEQPLAPSDDKRLPELRARCHDCVIHDESLVTIDDARRLMDLGVADVFNIRLSKCGGFLPSLKLAALARREGVGIQLGCMVGETSILAAAGIRFLQVCPRVRWAEGAFGTFLLARDVARRSLRFGYGGRPPKLKTRGFGVDVDSGRLEQVGACMPRVFHFG